MDGKLILEKSRQKPQVLPIWTQNVQSIFEGKSQTRQIQGKRINSRNEFQFQLHKNKYLQSIRTPIILTKSLPKELFENELVDDRKKKKRPQKVISSQSKKIRFQTKVTAKQSHVSNDETLLK